MKKYRKLRLDLRKKEDQHEVDAMHADGWFCERDSEFSRSLIICDPVRVTWDMDSICILTFSKEE